MNKVFVFGMDGATFDVMAPLMKKGILPNFARFMNEGTSGELRSTVPPSSAVAWPSFFTGKNPGKHGIFHFLALRPGTYRDSLINATSLRTRPLWEILNEKGKKAGVVNVPITYPPGRLDGFMITGLLTPSGDAIRTFPPDLQDELRSGPGLFALEHRVMKLYNAGKIAEALEELHRITDQQHRVLRYLLQAKTWDLFITVFRGTDLIQHGAGFTMEAGYEDTPGRGHAAYAALIPDFYQKMDRIFGDITAGLPEETTVVVMSDHGAGCIKAHFHINRWLVEHRYLKLLPFPRIRRRFGAAKQVSLAKIGRALGAETMMRHLPKKILNMRITIPDTDRNDVLVDWTETQVFSGFEGMPVISCRLNLKGREPRGIVEPGQEAERLKKELKEALLDEVDPQTGRKVVEKVCFAEEIYHGPCVPSAPDVIGMTSNLEYGVHGTLFSNRVVETLPVPHGQHRMNGVFMAKGPGIKKGHVLHGAEILDLAPTILYLLDLPVPDLQVVPTAGCNISEGRNIGIRRSRNNLIAVTDAGCRLAGNWLEEITRPLREDGSVGAVVGAVVADPRSPFERCAGLCCLSGTHGDILSIAKGSARSLAFRKSAWERGGRFPPWLPIGEDSFFIRSLEKSSRLVVNPKAEVYWRPRPNCRGILKQFFRYAQAAARTGMIWRIYRKTLFKDFALAVFLPTWSLTNNILWLLVPAGMLASYLTLKLLRGRSRAKTTDIIWMPIIVSVIHAGILAGLMTGIAERLVSPFWRNCAASGSCPSDIR